MKKFTLNGNNMGSVEEAYDEIENVLCPNFEFFGRNYDAFIDILRGGFGTFDYGEDITIQFNYMKYAKQNAGESFINMLIEIINEANNVNLILSEEEYIF